MAELSWVKGSHGLVVGQEQDTQQDNQQDTQQDTQHDDHGDTEAHSEGGSPGEDPSYETTIEDYYGPEAGMGFLNSVFYYSNILFYLMFCTFIATVRFGGEDFSENRDICVRGAFYEVQYATQLV